MPEVWCSSLWESLCSNLSQNPPPTDCLRYSNQLPLSHTKFIITFSHFLFLFFLNLLFSSFLFLYFFTIFFRVSILPDKTKSSSYHDVYHHHDAFECISLHFFAHVCVCILSFNHSIPFHSQLLRSFPLHITPPLLSSPFPYSLFFHQPHLLLSSLQKNQMYFRLNQS